MNYLVLTRTGPKKGPYPSSKLRRRLELGKLPARCRIERVEDGVVGHAAALLAAPPPPPSGETEAEETEGQETEGQETEAQETEAQETEAQEAEAEPVAKPPRSFAKAPRSIAKARRATAAAPTDAEAGSPEASEPKSLTLSGVALFLLISAVVLPWSVTDWSLYTAYHGSLVIQGVVVPNVVALIALGVALAGVLAARIGIRLPLLGALLLPAGYALLHIVGIIATAKSMGSGAPFFAAAAVITGIETLRARSR